MKPYFINHEIMKLVLPLSLCCPCPCPCHCHCPCPCPRPCPCPCPALTLALALVRALALDLVLALALALARGRYWNVSLTPFESRPSTAMQSRFCRLRFLFSIVPVDVCPLMSALMALHPRVRRRRCRVATALACEYLGVHFTLSSFMSSCFSVVSSMNLLNGLTNFFGLGIFAGGLPCRGQRNQGSPHSQVHCFDGLGTWQAPHQRGLAS